MTVAIVECQRLIHLRLLHPLSSPICPSNIDSTIRRVRTQAEEQAGFVTGAVASSSGELLTIDACSLRDSDSRAESSPIARRALQADLEPGTVGFDVSEQGGLRVLMHDGQIRISIKVKVCDGCTATDHSSAEVSPALS